MSERARRYFQRENTQPQKVALNIVKLADHGIDESADYQITTGKGQGRIGRPIVGRNNIVFIMEPGGFAVAVPLASWHERTKKLEGMDE